MEHYDWISDPNNYKIDGHIPPNRCFRCGFKFLGAQYAAFCNICDLAMTPDPDALMYVVTERPPKNTKATPQESEALGKGHWTTRRQFVQTRIRVPEDINESEFKHRMEEWENKQKEPIYYPDFRTANDLD